jgi:hypothetical protein
MAKRTQFPGSVEASAAATSYTDAAGAALEYDSGYACLSGKGANGAASIGVKLRALVAGVLTAVLTFGAGSVNATFAGTISAPGITSTSGLAVSSGTTAVQAITATTYVGSSSGTFGGAVQIGGAVGAPAASGTGSTWMARIVNTGSTSALIDMGVDGSPYGWIQPRNLNDYSLNYDLKLCPNGGTTWMGGAARVAGTGGTPDTSGAGAVWMFRIVNQAYSNAGLDFGAVTGGSPYSWLQSRNVAAYNANFDLYLNPNGGQVRIGTDGLRVASLAGTGTRTVVVDANGVMSAP